MSRRVGIIGFLERWGENIDDYERNFGDWTNKLRRKGDELTQPE